MPIGPGAGHPVAPADGAVPGVALGCGPCSLLPPHVSTLRIRWPAWTLVSAPSRPANQAGPPSRSRPPRSTTTTSGRCVVSGSRRTGCLRSMNRPLTLRLRWESALPVRLAELKSHEIEPPTLEGDGYRIAVYGIPGAGFKGEPDRKSDAE